MKPMTPRGTRTRAISTPLGRRQTSTVSPTGSGSPATCRRPTAISSIRASVRVRRSSEARVSPADRARSRSARLASSTAGVFSSSPRAICCRASFFARVGASARAPPPPLPPGPWPRHAPRRPCCPLLRCPSEDDEVVPVDHLVQSLVAQRLFDVRRLRPADLPQLIRIVVDESPRELRPVPSARPTAAPAANSPSTSTSPEGKRLLPLSVKALRAPASTISRP